MFTIFGKKDLVYFPGCMAYKFQDGIELYKKIFSKIGISFMVLKPMCCGLEPWELGYESLARKLAKQNFDFFKEQGIKSIITTSPGSYKMFLYNYSNYIPDWDIKVENVYSLILKKLEDKESLIKNKLDENVSFNDNCYLGRYCNIYNEPRKILQLIGYNIKELDNSKEESFCSGSCGSLHLIDPELADKIAKEKILQVKRIGAKKLIVVGFEDYYILNKNSDIKVLEFSEVLANAFGIKSYISEETKIEEKEKDILLETKANIMLQEELKEENF